MNRRKLKEIAIRNRSALAGPLETKESQNISAALTRDAESADLIAKSIVSIWRDIDIAMRPIIGERGVAMLYKRSLHITSRARPWLKDIGEDSQHGMDLAALGTVIAKQSCADAAAAGGVFLMTFHELLSSLIGPSLTERLLRSIWNTFSSGPPAQDTTT